MAPRSTPASQGGEKAHITMKFTRQEVDVAQQSGGKSTSRHARELKKTVCARNELKRNPGPRRKRITERSQESTA